MATRNLTKKFIDIRNANKANRGLGLQVILFYYYYYYYFINYILGKSTQW